MRTAPLGPQQRTQALARMAEQELDVLVVGGGVVGAGTALDSVTRGLSTGLVEARDWASGTSSRSSKLIHGGLRYLEMLDFALVREALKERGLLLQRLAPHLVHPVPFLYPLTRRGWERLYAGSGVALYDTMAFSSGHGRGLPHHRHLTRRHALRVAPCLRKDALVGALQYYDGQVDDARFVTTLVRTAASYGAQTANRARVVGFLREGERVVGARVLDAEQGGEYEVRARQVVNATGVWTDETQALVGERGQFHVRASKGIHLVVPKDRIHSTTGLILRTEKSVLFVIPWGRHWIVGTTDTDWNLDKAHPAASSADIDYLLEHVNSVLAVPLTRDDVEGVYAGLRPLLAGESEATSQLSREHTVAHAAPGLVVVAGGKYTTYRVMAKDAVDAAVHGLDGRVAACCTEDVPLAGAVGYPALWNARARLAARAGLHVARVEHLLNRYGSLVDEVLELIAADASLGEPLTGAEDYLRAEVVYAASHEGARHLDDVLTRRTRISIETFDRGTRCARQAAELMAPVLGWDGERTRREVEHYEKRVEAERESQRQPDDLTADAARLGAPDIVPH
ncbi:MULTISPECIES: glycerol-3-phosphate dehydrogenase/oxidase [Streptomycetaceae]|uniref:Glycerol-3-phosphate dehydrogenase n=1 Tax=Streptantibioticus cattleyicolor (strain ATCC 35852 / DSM 46488 / JCM 4925 / NBRC 14057 / NRRL 8057) TaxID=1003195 RepID=F8JZE7_STREN|nr:glycerol-3-phosphate dehydrogenase/oxidase [Streptantibioticus cattleyicolor]AEW96029.1 glycerol phosphate dehydrogenase [Streptantibioticus cattleyicolor NRRL 8057 = DSM 46488]MYS60560.1 FAD-dependent oxidoreductase [Streptomyces sp. SID5468]CCB76363.1 Glycerol-3-phosphate dehydrogenase 2 [Streptantibioticus cattleyicolor NRRL 8057 = DSM 46488]